MKRTQIMKRDNLLVNYLFSRKGIDNAASQRDIANYLINNGYIIKEKYVNSIIRKLISDRKLPICSSNGKG